MILVLRKAFHSLKNLSESFRLIVDGSSAYPFAAQQFQMTYGDAFKFAVTHVIGLTNDDDVSKKFCPFKQLVERLNRTFKSSYLVRCGYDNYNGSSCNVALWIAYYNFLRLHQSIYNNVLNKVTKLDGTKNMPGKWQIMIYLRQQTILRLQGTATRCLNNSLGRA
ncbi:DDE-type integrase/transposase/recombinase [Pectinatus frisingensis]|uniref:DDE-type integrase/transposase/recombinase n=1 Tax=Pectinatus frisingensis TaxID=865 RepID=UPI0018C5DEBB|nr:DDE-type integrase/transposase/recombinase [Pectinatus frisingensis]